MSTDGTVSKLTATQIQALVVLMAEARELTNNELKDLAGFTLTGADNKKLVDAGLVETNKSHRPFSHALSDKGWRVARELHTTPPGKASAATKTLLVLLANVQRSLDRQDVSHAMFFTRSALAAPVANALLPVPAGPADTGDTEAGDTGDTEAAVRDAYANLAKAPGEWVGLADLRAHLAGVDRATLDDTLRRMAHQTGVRIIPIADSKNVDARERGAALRIGSQDNHAIAIEAP